MRENIIINPFPPPLTDNCHLFSLSNGGNGDQKGPQRSQQTPCVTNYSDEAMLTIVDQRGQRGGQRIRRVRTAGGQTGLVRDFTQACWLYTV
jgi:hypothetical protein